jgi:hypothetical protein
LPRAGTLLTGGGFDAVPAAGTILSILWPFAELPDGPL